VNNQACECADSDVTAMNETSSQQAGFVPTTSMSNTSSQFTVLYDSLHVMVSIVMPCYKLIMHLLRVKRFKLAKAYNLNTHCSSSIPFHSLSHLHIAKQISVISQFEIIKCDLI
jgi:hypothetical protein